MMRYFRYVCISLLLLIGCAWLIKYQLSQPPLAYVQNKESPALKLGGPFCLIDQFGKTRTNQEFLGKYMLIYFGYTFCPDICPMGLQNMAKAITLLGRDREAIVPIFITIDPERDTVDSLNLYASNFSIPFIMLTGNRPQIDSAMKAFKVYASKSQEKHSTTDYLMDHSTMIYLMGRDGVFLEYFLHSDDPEITSKAIQKHLLKEMKQIAVKK